MGFQLFSQQVHADNANSQYQYSVEVDDSKNTSAIQQTVKPGQQLNVKLVFANNSNQVQTLRVNFNTAVTGDNGVIQYNFTDLTDRYFGRVNFSKLISGPKTIKLAAKAKVIQEYTIKVPKQSFSGVIAGGFYIAQADGSNQSNQQSGVNFKNVISYAIPIVLRENNRSINTKLALNQVLAKMHYGYPTVIAKIDNLTPTMFGQMKIKTHIIDQSNNQVVFKQIQTNMNMAPLTRMSYPVVINKKLAAGDYTLKLAVSSGKAHWNFKHSFSINAKLADATAKQSKTKGSPPVWIYVVIGSVVLLGLLVSVFYLGKSKSK
ncbi:DUF3324 domain-containing protein [Lactobacillus sp. Sy-1]|uniref:DUF3324 domain-containing protein n=1 Tax=Lactobacillus sp. Sy-1 TaxID=2109645 RepID=UPI001C57FBAE|nr:DUF3324 domain-containing protein [Lactobacillus sp. Sy-1]MBW1605574.1 DUF3324 domain-containing protein [Lactobacillus sp. Sy-1]